MIVGRKIETTIKTFKNNHKYFKMIVKQDWWLNATKGYKLGLKIKTIKEISPHDFYPRVYSKVEFVK